VSFLRATLRPAPPGQTARRPLPADRLLGGLLLRGRAALPPVDPEGAAARPRRPARL